MTPDVDRILRAHADEAAQAVPPPDGWARLEERLDEVDAVIPLHPRAPRRVAWMAAAAAVLILMAGLGVLAATSDEDGNIDTTIPATEPTTDGTERPATSAPTTTPSTTEPPTPSTETTTTSPPADLPQGVVGILDPDDDGIGDLVRVDADGEVEVLVQGTPGNGALEEGGPTGASSFAVLPDGRIVVEMCCEPAAGDVRIIDPDTGDAAHLSFGRNPAVSPDGRRVAVSVRYNDDEIYVFDVDAAPETGGPLLVGGHPIIGATGDRSVTGLAWSPDGSRLAIETVRNGNAGTQDPSVDIVDLGSGERVEVPGAVDAAFLADGRVLASTDAQVIPGSWAPLVATSLVIVDPATGAASPHIGDVEVIELAGTADRRWILATSPSGAVRAFAAGDGRDSGTVLSLDGLVAAA